jgi:hypothetical protein
MIVDNQLDDAPNLFCGLEPLEEFLDTFFSLLAGFEFQRARCVTGQFTRINGISGIVFEDNFDAGKHGLQRQGRVGDGCFVRQGGGFEDQLGTGELCYDVMLACGLECRTKVRRTLAEQRVAAITKSLL